MDSDPHNLNDLLAEIEGISLRTSQGSFVKVEDLKKVMERRQLISAVDEATAFTGKTFSAANRAIKNDPQFDALTKRDPREPGRSVPATEPQSPSRA